MSGRPPLPTHGNRSIALAALAAGVLAGCAARSGFEVGPELAGTYVPDRRDPGEALILNANGTFTHEFVAGHQLALFVVGTWTVQGGLLRLQPVAAGDATASRFPLAFGLIGHGASVALVPDDVPADAPAAGELWRRRP